MDAGNVTYMGLESKLAEHERPILKGRYLRNSLDQIQREDILRFVAPSGLQWLADKCSNALFEFLE